MSGEKRMNRRAFLRASATTALGALLASCAQPTPQVIEKQVPVEKVIKETVVVEKQVPVEKVVKETVIVEKQVAVEKVVTATPVPAKYKEAPMLAELVKAGKLPPVDQRVGQDPLVVQPNEKIGKYGGDWRLGGIRFGAFQLRCTEYENLTRWNVPWTDVVPNVVKSWKIEGEGKTYIFDLRKGMKWSDGNPFTADDILFWYEESSNKELYPSFPKTWSTGNDPVVVTKVDDYTVKFAFSQPYGLFIQRLATPGGQLYSPKHFRKQFFPAYADKDFLAKKIKDSGVSYWYEGYNSWVAPQLNLDTPVIYGWKYTSKFGDSPTHIAERNPYYWKVDPEGNQLPYLDRHVYTIAQDVQVLVMKVVAGELDFQDLYVTELSNKPLYAENAQKADIRFMEVTSGESSAFPMSMNLTHEDPVTREIFQNKDFRIALSHAINRDEIIQTVFLGMAEAAQPSPVPQSPLYSEKMTKQYLEYDPAKANKILDGILPKKDAEGYRLRPDGKTLGIVAEVDASSKADLDSLEMVKKYWSVVGIKMAVKATENSLINTRALANQHDLIVIYSIPGGMDAIFDPRGYFPYGTQSYCFIPWARWYLTGGKEGQEPNAPAKKQQELFDKLLMTVGTAAQNEIMKQILKIAEEQFWQFTICRPPKGYAICKNKFRNVPDKYWGSWQYPNPAPLNACQFFWDK